MPLYENAIEQIRTNREQIARGEKARVVAIGTLADSQLNSINASRALRKNHLGEPDAFPPIEREIVMIGRHLYNSRIVKDGYTIDEVIEQIVNALSDRAGHIQTQRATLIQDRQGRTNRFGEFVRDEAVLECSARYPRPELLSVIPKGETAQTNERPHLEGKAFRFNLERLARVTRSFRRPSRSVSIIPPVSRVTRYGFSTRSKNAAAAV